MKIVKNYIFIFALMFTVTACMDNYEDLPVDQFTYDYVFSPTDSSGTQARYFLNAIYDAVEKGHNRVGGDYLDAASDDAISLKVNSNPDIYKLFSGRYTSSNRVSSDMQWGTYMNAIRKVNIFLSGIERVPFNTTYINALGEKRPLGVSMKAEARFLRAWFYFQLLERYGGVPLLGDHVYGLNEDIQLPRSTFANTVDYIVNELDVIQDSLRDIPMNDAANYAHAATKPACMALKARVLLYAASPLFNGQLIEEGNELVGYASFDRLRWKKAADAARSFILLYGEKGRNTFNLAPDFRDVFLNFYGQKNPELIFFRQDGKSTTIENMNGPLGFSGTKLGMGRTNPTQNLVDAFPMKDGYAVGESPKYQYNENQPYENRDPRLDYTVLHNGSNWLGTQLLTWRGGANNPSGGTDYSQTSYYMRKFMGPFETATEYADQLHLWVMLRYAEVLLNFAEAENESLDSPSSEIYDAIIALRRRAGIEPGDNNMYGLSPGMTQSDMRQIIHNERRIELAFEEHRYFDIRRWREAENVFSSPLRGMNIIKGANTVTYGVNEVARTTFETKRYLYPLPYSEINKNKNLKQNPFWK